MLKQLIKRSLLAAVAVLTAAAGYHASYWIKADETAVFWHRLHGTQHNRTYGAGLHFVAPWHKLYRYPNQPQQAAARLTVLSRSGDPVSLQYEVVYQLKPATLSQLHQTIGPAYLDVLLKPEIEAAFRQAFGQLTNQQLLTLKITALSNTIRLRLNQAAGELEHQQQRTRYIDIHSLRLINHQLSVETECGPEQYAQIERKLGTGDSMGHGPDIGSAEWQSTVERRLKLTQQPDLPAKDSAAWCGYIQGLLKTNHSLKKQN